MPFHPFLAFSFSALIVLLGCVFSAFIVAVSLSLVLTAVEEVKLDELFCSLFKWCIKNRHRRPAIFLAHRRPDLTKVFTAGRSLDEMAFLCEAISHVDISKDHREKEHMLDNLYQYIHTSTPLYVKYLYGPAMEGESSGATAPPLYVKYLVEVLIEQGWDINSKLDMVYKEAEIRELVYESLYSRWKKPDPAIWQKWKPRTDSYFDHDRKYQCIGTLAALLKANRRYDTLYLLLKSFPQFEKSCAPLFNIAPSDLPEFLLISAYDAYKFTD